MNREKGAPKIAIAAMSVIAMAALGISPGLASLVWKSWDIRVFAQEKEMYGKSIR